MRYRLYKFNRTIYCYIQYIIIEFTLEGDHVVIKPKYIVPGQLGPPPQCTIDTALDYFRQGMCPHWFDLIFTSNNYEEIFTYLFVKTL